MVQSKELGANTVFVAWSRLSRRTRDLAEVLGLSLFFVPDGPPYLRAWIETKRYLEKTLPCIVLVQLPQGPLLYRVAKLSKKIGYRVLADTHTRFIYPDSIASKLLNSPFVRYLKDTELVIVHNPPVKQLLLRKLKGLSEQKVLVVYDPLPKKPQYLKKPGIPQIDEEPFIAVPASWAPDEPLDVLVRGFLRSAIKNDYRLVITGDPSRNRKLYKRIMQALRDKSDRERVIISGFLSEHEYAWLLSYTKAVIAITKREYTMLSAIWEAVAYNKPLIVSDTATLRSIIGDNYPCFFRPDETSIAKTLSTCTNRNPEIKTIIDKLENLSKTTINMLRERINEIRETNCP